MSTEHWPGHYSPTAPHATSSSLARKKSAEDIAWHVRLLIPFLGELQLQHVHDETLEPFVKARQASGVAGTTINRSLEVVRTILNRSSRVYRDKEGRPWLEAPVPLITMQPESRRQPYPITWEEQDRLFPLLPAHLGRMVLFAVNTGLRDSNVCKLQWTWEVPVPEIGRSVFVIPPEAFKTNRPYVVILNDTAWSIVEAQRGKHAIWVFPYRGEPVNTMNNTAWQGARRSVGLRSARIHDLRHTFASRLRAAGVSDEDRAALLGHSSSSMPQHYASPDVRRLIHLANRVLERTSVVTIVRIYGAGRGEKRFLPANTARPDEAPKFGRVLAFRGPRQVQVTPAGSR
jgi:integrase